MKTGAALLLAGCAALAMADDLAGRAAALRSELDQARAGKLPEYLAARSGLEACARALRGPGRGEREQDCTEAQRRVEACESRREEWARSLDQFGVDARAAGRAERHAALLHASLAECPATLPGSREGPAAALAAAGRREREALPSYPVCESYLRAMFNAADADRAQLVEDLAQELVGRCGAEHPDYRRHADAALIRVGREPAQLDRPRPAAAAASAASAP